MDGFTDRRFRLLDAWLPNGLMQAIAPEADRAPERGKPEPNAEAERQEEHCLVSR
ncbi:hypothetical protein [Streptacidiphilus albus]|uniref:hypothetical protein n=1 Tax=Streptacidiphilus albus TaxID=105425 RepID=UPI000AD14DAD|nr:hypothetical protein [Streptacidiphilus albus]